MTGCAQPKRNDNFGIRIAAGKTLAAADIEPGAGDCPISPSKWHFRHCAC
jgi:hypothetical protein